MSKRSKRKLTGLASNGYLTGVTGPVAGATMGFTNDGFGRVRTATDAQGYVTTTDYDAMDRPTQVTYPDSTTSQINYQRLDAQFMKDRLGRWTHIFTNALRQPVAVMDAQGHVTTTNWTLSAGPGSVVDANGNATTWKHDNQDRVTEKDYPDGHSERIAYENTTSRVKSVTDNKGQVATNTYFKDNTVQQTVYTNATVATPTVSYGYDAVYPRVRTMTDGTGTTTYNYNPITTTPTLGAGQVGSVSVPVAGTTATLANTVYDELGRVTTSTLDGSANSQSTIFDTLGRVTSVTNALSASPFIYAYLNNTGRVASVTNPNGQKAVYTYIDSTTTGEPRLSEIKNQTSSGVIISKHDYLLR